MKIDKRLSEQVYYQGNPYGLFRDYSLSSLIDNLRFDFAIKILACLLYCASIAFAKLNFRLNSDCKFGK